MQKQANITTLVKTISSLEIVKIINDMRDDNQPELQHSDFLKKVPKVLGDEVAGNFSGYYKAANGKRNPCFNFPKREASLMVMSESYKVQAKVYDRLDDLENNKSVDAITVALKLLPIAFKAAKILGLDKNETMLSANKAVITATGVSPLKLLGHDGISSETQKTWHTPTEIGKEIGLSAQALNKILEEYGLQEKIADTWSPTKDTVDRGLARVFDTGKKHSNGVSIQQIKWSTGILDVISCKPKRLEIVQ